MGIKPVFHTIFSRIMVVFLIVIIPLYVGGILIYLWGLRSIRDDLTASMERHIRSGIRELEGDIRRVRSLELAIGDDEDLMFLATFPTVLGTIARTRSIVSIQKNLLALQNSHPAILSSTVYIPALDRAIYSEDSIDVLPQDRYQKLRLAQPTGLSNLVIIDGQLLLPAYFPFRYVDLEKEQKYILEVELDMNRLLDRLYATDTLGGSAMLIGLHSDFSTGYNRIEAVEADIQAADLGVKEGAEFGISRIRSQGIPYLIAYVKSEYLDIELVRYVPESYVFEPLKNYTILFWLLTAAAVLVIIPFSASTNKLIRRPLADIVAAFRKVETGDLSVRISHPQQDEFRYLADGFDQMVSKLEQLIDQTYKLKILMQRSELKKLQAQIHPHFFYNCFFSLHHMIERGDYEVADRFTQQLGVYFQYVTRNASDEVSLKEEASHAAVYCDIQSQRFKNRLSVTYGEIPAELALYPVPRLSIQPLIENVFEHGLRNKVEGGLIQVTFEEVNHHLVVRVEDNGDETSDSTIESMQARLNDDETVGENTGIINIHQRLRLMYDQDSGLRFYRSPLGGLGVEMTVGPSKPALQGG